MIKRTYKTLDGFFTALDRRSGMRYANVSAEKFFRGEIYVGCEKGRDGKLRLVYITAAQSLREAVAKDFAAANWKRGREEKAKALASGRGDLSYLQCFLIERHTNGVYYYGTSLSGDAYEYCKRMYSRSIR